MTGSKSESNRLLLLQSIFPELQIENLSNADDVKVMQEGLKARSGTVDIHHAGTAMRFLTAFFATREGSDVTLTGSSRMQERPIEVLVEALRELGADITYLGERGYPPLHIRGKSLQRFRVSLPADISSQYISALLLVAPGTPSGIELELLGKITSVPYIRMTLSLLESLGISTEFSGNRITVKHAQRIEPKTLRVESDWSSASYFYSIVALSLPGTRLALSSYRPDSLQGDSILVEVYKQFGVESRFEGSSLHLEKVSDVPNVKGAIPPKTISLHLADAPDIAQTVAVTCFGLGMGCKLTGLHTLKIKETDRLEALKNELSKMGAQIRVSENHLELDPGGKILSNKSIATYNDHRMAMAFAPLALKTSLFIEDAGVVSKSYPDFWEDLRKLNFRIRKEAR
ncbi:3-phosphoshikimate 1-carboxyvinyltransferase [Muriicola jejuensis]|uniref:3-phosphoshikimate 1-carboxyvinyltransferase n=2 Tax=Muriicola jejuensis TaxID=504488 RepID=A0A6P0UCK5_9FLAO|nr:3-phosphoshikimate 1-carboxyvinyltransferase [Muriicola jejuensis]NER09358.1 3-phosphoshikimate 1-carboxyvinyltransferase [Muriicola jejuensis]